MGKTCTFSPHNLCNSSKEKQNYYRPTVNWKNCKPILLFHIIRARMVSKKSWNKIYHHYKDGEKRTIGGAWERTQYGATDNVINKFAVMTSEKAKESQEISDDENGDWFVRSRHEDFEADRECIDSKGWFRFHKCYFDFTYFIFIAPFRFRQDALSGKYQLVSSFSHSVICGFLQVASLLYIRTTFLAGWDWVKAGEDKISYFDLMFLVLLYGFDICTKWTLWIHQTSFYEFFHEMQESPLMRLPSSWQPAKVNILVFTITCTYLIPSVLYIALVLGVSPSDMEGLLEGLRAHTKSLFFLDDVWEESKYFGVFEACASIITIYTSAFWHYSDVLVLVSTICFHRITIDFFDAIFRGDIPDRMVFSYYSAYKALNKKFNRAAGLVACVFVTYPLSYYATHLVDMLNDSDLMNRFTMCIYLGNMSLTLYLGAMVHRKGQTMKRWLEQKHKFYITTPALALTLFELSNNQLGINGFFTITQEFAGNVVNLLLTLTIITIQFRMST